ncbi:MAG: SDR family NAD(P)-dependent oxidoreductase [Acutalibacteraceae bacterium]|nr:SDR family NAD(P)-dependent oxidoreductase [Acutalibacteraceae bacterium]
MNIAVITGASSGIGFEYAKAVYETRTDLDEIWVIARRADRLQMLQDELGSTVIPLPFDITDPQFTDSYTNLLKEKNATVKLLINNAGFGKLGNFDELSLSDNTGMVRLNCEALTAVTSATLPFMNENSEIINTSSIASFAPNTRMAVYSSTKAYVTSFSRALKAELKPRKINVLAVCPGPMSTEFMAVANIDKGSSKTFDTLPRVNPRTMALKSLKASHSGRAVYTNRLFFKFYRLLAKILPHSLVMKFCGT